MTGSESSRDGLAARWVPNLLGRAGVGAGVTVLVSLVPFVGLLAPAIGGGVASRVGEQTAGDGSRVGAIAGAIVVLLSLPVTFLALAAAAAVSPLATVGVFGATLVGAIYVIGSGALGGYLADEFAETTDADVAPVGEPPIERLKQRYVDGELEDDEFERRLERLVAADDVRDAPSTSRERPDDRRRTTVPNTSDSR
ncbi:hypothetical protein JCM18237_12410 [Halorubrum luteum]